MSRTIFSLYRTYLRQIRRLPLFYLREFFKIKAADDFRAIVRSSSEGLRKQKIKRVSRDLRKIEEGISGSNKAFAYVLDLAYGRKGKLKRELMEPLLSDPNAPTPPRIIPSVERSRPPVYPSELKALLTSGHSRSTRPLTPISLKKTPALPIHIDPSTEDAKLLGRFSKRREVNIRWRFFVNEWKKVYPPLQVVAREGDQEGVSDTDILRAGIRGLGMQGRGVFEDISSIAGPLHTSATLTRKERRSADNVLHEWTSSHPPRHPSRWLRRRYQELLGRLPVLTYSRRSTDSPGKYAVSLSPNAIAPSLYMSVGYLPELKSVDDQEWLALAQGDSSRKPAGQKRQTDDIIN